MEISILMDVIEKIVKSPLTSGILTIIIIIYTLDREVHLHLRLWGCIKRQLIFSFNRVGKSVKRVDNKIKKSDFNPDLIIGIGGGKYVGGPIIASLLASKKCQHENCVYLELPRDGEGHVIWEEADKVINMCLPKIKSYLSEVGKNILLVDDVSKTGDTISETKKRVEEKLKDIFPTIKVAVIVIKKESVEELEENFWKKEFYYRYNEKREVKFPWEI